MTSAHTVEAVRRAEAAADPGLPDRPPAQDGPLMLRAAAGLASVVAGEVRRRRGRLYGARVALLVGVGSNGGDALHAGARLAAGGAQVVALLAGPRAHAGGLAALRAAGGRVLPAAAPTDGDHGRRRAAARSALAGADVVLDGLLGTGGRPGLDASASALVAAVPAGALVVAVDVPSGVAADSGELPRDPRGRPACVHADVTVTFGTAKPALLLPPAVRAAGRVVVVDTGLDPAVLGPAAVEELEPEQAALLWPVPGPQDDKYSRGVLGVVAGGDTYTGAALLCTTAAVLSGAGMVRYVGPPRPTDLVRQRLPEVVPGAGRVQAWAVGSGVDPDDGAQAAAVSDALAAALDDGVPALLDAGALPALAARLRDTGPLDPRRTAVLLTPHAGELARLLSGLDGPDGEEVDRTAVEGRPLEHAQRAARATGAVVLLKGSTTLLGAPDGRVRSQTDGPGWLGTAGAGDVLAGVAGTLLAAGLDPFDAGALATAVHGRAAALASGGGPLHAEAVARAVPGVVAHLLTRREWPS
ncbi:bifunctional ADP-dependent NAD(P)H-hydrate dehydratase/NAD(P)H-hydrate epimerase [Streptomyces sp. NP160]|uniref:bifunctional ADP-dependent NAD(P)H-hydrate dehydratase/NAD(P)H-hydrate epimerase n=1 Tax=Streptomyces sp. NP160 TaxID=2586637 RepID=UPI001117C045|nr:bifunctional ADP-dependent NAD(P)H-hydrate dehydratase/NAD(P)H-hydrate epimerase [Streptomyces sp. NP160]TNM69856.1 bifunctional ADP-dependent NAD(P)H-hydrate dehydratase/NAD(P)H-hydrate epimerase [Streptomyces sp. NP160]